MDNKQKFDQSAYIQQYMKDKYTECKVRFKADEYAELTEYCEITGLSKQKLIKNCIHYCFKNYVENGTMLIPERYTFCDSEENYAFFYEMEAVKCWR